MKVFTKYIADDGKEFRDKDECLEYEANLAIGNIAGHVKVFGSNKTQLNLATCDWANIYYLWFDGNDKAVQELIRLWGKNSGDYCPITECYHPNGVYAYDESTCDWYFVPDRVKEIQNLIAEIEKAVKKS